jgi:hypothetical protein
MSLLKERNKKIREANLTQLSTYFNNKYQLQGYGHTGNESVVFKPAPGTKLKEMMLDAFMVKGLTKKKIFVEWYNGLHEIPVFNSNTRRDIFTNFYQKVRNS